MSGHSDAPTLTLMPEPLTLLRLEKSHLDLCSRQLIKLAFFNELYAHLSKESLITGKGPFCCHVLPKTAVRCKYHPSDPNIAPLCPPYVRPSSFFSYTETEEEISLILDEGSRKQFATVIEELQLPSQQWRAIEIFEGPQALDQTGYIARFSEPLARHRVDLIYVSTYNTDLILVMEDSAERALTSLQQVAHVDPANSIITASSGGQTSAPNSSSYRGSNKLPKFVLQDDVDAMQGDSPDTHVLGHLENRLNLVHFSSSQVSSLSHALLKIFLFPSHHDRFFSYTSYGGQVTLIVDDSEMDTLRPHLEAVTHHEHLWNAIHIQASPEGIDSGVVNYAANVLAANAVSIYYLSTLNDDYILVPEQSTTLALESLQGLTSPGIQYGTN